MRYAEQLLDIRVDGRRAASIEVHRPEARPMPPAAGLAGPTAPEWFTVQGAPIPVGATVEIDGEVVGVQPERKHWRPAA